MARSSETAQEQTIPRNLNILWLYHLYRLTVGLALVALTATEDKDSILSLPYPAAYHYLSWSYLPLTLLLAIAVNRPEKHRAVFTLAALDVLLLLCLFGAAAGVRNGIGNFIVIAVAIANTLLPRTLGLLLAASAALGMLAISLFLDLAIGAPNALYVQAGIAGGLGLVSAAVVQMLSARLRATETLAKARADELAGLQTLNAMIIERMGAGVLVLDDQLKVLLCNQNARTALGVEYPQGNALGQLFPALLKRIEDWRHNPILRQQALPAPAGRLSLSPTFVTLGQRTHQQTLVFLEDASRITQQAQEMKLASLGRLAASIAHEIRNPLAAISHAAQLLQESETLDAPDRRLGQIIQEQSKRMNHIIDDVLQLSRRRPAESNSLDLAHWLERYLREFRETADAGQQLHLKADNEVLLTQMDASHLTQILANLVNNGLRHSAQKNGRGQVWLHLYRAPQSGQPVLDVIDDGPGVSEKQLPYLFEPFHTTEIGGTGLGLYICKELCEANEASLDYLRLGEDRSSCFRIMFAHPYKQPLPHQQPLHNGDPSA